MEHTQFYDRRQELAMLKKRYAELKSGELLVLYGRRRVGKTELLKQFLKTVPANKLYFYVDLAEKQGLLDSLSRAVQEQLNETRTFSEFSDFLDYIDTKSDERFVLVIDEFQRFLDVAPQFITQLQNDWDQRLKHRKILLILLGSSIGMIHKITGSRAGALYGRATKVKISPFRYADFRAMFKDLREEDKITLYSVFGGTPYYLEKAKRIEGDIHKKIFELMLKKDADLTEEPKNLLEYENVRAHAKYNSILQAAASGKQTSREINEFTGIDANILPTYTKKLDELLDLLSRNDPVLGKERYGRYIIRDNFFKFWYRFVFPNQTAMNLGNYKVAEDSIKENLNAHVGRIFEGVCKELLIAKLNKDINGYALDFENIGSWWNRTGEEIDLVAYNRKSKRILVGEAKWTNHKMDIDAIDDLLRKSKLIQFTGDYKLMFLSKNGFTERALNRIRELNALSLDLKDIERLFDEMT